MNNQSAGAGVHAPAPANGHAVTPSGSGSSPGGSAVYQAKATTPPYPSIAKAQDSSARSHVAAGARVDYAHDDKQRQAKTDSSANITQLTGGAQNVLPPEYSLVDQKRPMAPHPPMGRSVRSAPRPQTTTKRLIPMVKPRSPAGLYDQSGQHIKAGSRERARDAHVVRQMMMQTRARKQVQPLPEQFGEHTVEQYMRAHDAPAPQAHDAPAPRPRTGLSRDELRRYVEQEAASFGLSCSQMDREEQSAAADNVVRAAAARAAERAAAKAAAKAAARAAARAAAERQWPSAAGLDIPPGLRRPAGSAPAQDRSEARRRRMEHPPREYGHQGHQPSYHDRPYYGHSEPGRGPPPSREYGRGGHHGYLNQQQQKPPRREHLPPPPRPAENVTRLKTVELSTTDLDDRHLVAKEVPHCKRTIRTMLRKAGEILILAESDFSFSAGLIDHFQVNAHVVATSFDSEEKLQDLHKEKLETNLKKVRGRTDCDKTILHEVDCTSIEETIDKAIRKKPKEEGDAIRRRWSGHFDLVWLQLPHTGGTAKTNSNMIQRFLGTVGRVLKPNGMVFLTLYGMQVDHWKVAQHASIAQMAPVLKIPFNTTIYPAIWDMYNPKVGFSNGFFDILRHPCDTFVFCQNEFTCVSKLKAVDPKILSGLRSVKINTIADLAEADKRLLSDDVDPKFIRLINQAKAWLLVWCKLPEIIQQINPGISQTGSGQQYKGSQGQRNWSSGSGSGGHAGGRGGRGGGHMSSGRGHPGARPGPVHNEPAPGGGYNRSGGYRGAPARGYHGEQGPYMGY